MSDSVLMNPTHDMYNTTDIAATPVWFLTIAVAVLGLPILTYFGQMLRDLLCIVCEWEDVKMRWIQWIQRCAFLYAIYPSLAREQDWQRGLVLCMMIATWDWLLAWCSRTIQLRTIVIADWPTVWRAPDPDEPLYRKRVKLFVCVGIFCTMNWLCLAWWNPYNLCHPRLRIWMTVEGVRATLRLIPAYHTLTPPTHGAGDRWIAPTLLWEYTALLTESLSILRTMYMMTFILYEWFGGPFLGWNSIFNWDLIFRVYGCINVAYRLLFSYYKMQTGAELLFSRERQQRPTMQLSETGRIKAGLVSLRPPQLAYAHNHPFPALASSRENIRSATMEEIALMVGAGTDCAICSEPPSRPSLVLACGHIFDQVCLSRWFAQNHTTCPVCRADTNPPL